MKKIKLMIGDNQWGDDIEAEVLFPDVKYKVKVPRSVSTFQKQKERIFIFELETRIDEDVYTYQLARIV
jgi:hypothetical protein